MKKFNLLWAVLITSIGIFFACTKTDSLSDQYNAGPVVTATLKGRVLDTAGKPVIGATVTVGSTSVTTDIDGRFRLNNVSMNKNTGFVKVSKTGFFNGSRTFMVSTDAANYVEVMLIPKTISGTFSATAGGDINPSNGGTISFSANSIINESTGAAYSGTVSVSAFFLNPEDDNFNQYMPGDLRGINTSNEERVLQSYGMMAVELNGAGGEKLQIASGKTATISSPIPAAMQANAPATIPLWYFDEAKGMWVEQGVATKQGNNYVGTVSHFSFWNYDISLESVIMKMKITDNNSVPLAHVNVMISLKRINPYVNLPTYGTVHGYTDENGMINGPVPSNEVLIVKVYALAPCASIIYTSEVGPFVSNVDLGTVTTNYTPPFGISINGTVANCSGGPVTNGYVQIFLDNSYHNTPIVSGVFSFNTYSCNAGPRNASIIAVDQTAGQQGDPVQRIINSGTYNIGQISACGLSTNEFINLSLNGNTYIWLRPNDSLHAESGMIDSTNPGSMFQGWQSLNPQGYNEIFAVFSDTTLGTHPLKMLEMHMGYPINYYTLDPGAVPNVLVTELGSPGQFISGSFNGTVKNYSTSQVVPVTCSFRVRRFQ